MEHMLSKSKPLDFYLSIDVIISKVSFVKTICKPFQIHGCLSWLRKSDLSLVVCKATVSLPGLPSSGTCFLKLLRWDNYLELQLYFFMQGHICYSLLIISFCLHISIAFANQSNLGCVSSQLVLKPCSFFMWICMFILLHIVFIFKVKSIKSYFPRTKRA